MGSFLFRIRNFPLEAEARPLVTDLRVTAGRAGSITEGSRDAKGAGTLVPEVESRCHVLEGPTLPATVTRYAQFPSGWVCGQNNPCNECNLLLPSKANKFVVHQ